MKPYFLIPLAALPLAAPAAEPALPDPAFVATLHARYPSTDFRSVRTTPVPGIYEVVMGKTIAYAAADARHFFLGRLFDMAMQTDLTAPAAERLLRADPKILEGLLDAAVVSHSGKGTRVLWLFTDPDCPFCKKLEATLAKLADTQVRRLYYPIAELHPKARAKALGLVRRAHPQADAERLLARIREAAGTLSVSATPTLFDARGRRLTGSVTEDALRRWLDAGSPREVQP